jgi:hypothetical protein
MAKYIDINAGIKKFIETMQTHIFAMQVNGENLLQACIKLFL